MGVEAWRCCVGDELSQGKAERRLASERHFLPLSFYLPSRTVPASEWLF